MARTHQRFSLLPLIELIGPVACGTNSSAAPGTSTSPPGTSGAGASFTVIAGAGAGAGGSTAVGPDCPLHGLLQYARLTSGRPEVSRERFGANAYQPGRRGEAREPGGEREQIFEPSDCEVLEGGSSHAVARPRRVGTHCRIPAGGIQLRASQHMDGREQERHENIVSCGS